MAEAGQSMGGVVWRRFAVLALLLCVPSVPAQQVPGDMPGGLSGRLTDAYSHPVGSAAVVLRNAATGAETRTTTRANGTFRLSSLPPGEYKLIAESPAIGHGELDEITIFSGHESKMQASLTMVLPVPPPVLPTLETLTPSTPVMNTALPAEQMQAIPLNGRNWQNFALDTPTANVPEDNPMPKGLDATDRSSGAGEAGTGGGTAEMRGSSSMQPSTIVEGMNATAHFKARGWGRGGGATMAEGAIARVEVQAGNGEVEGSRSPGGMVSATTRRGENGLHGQVFFFDRGNVWGARNPFTQLLTESSPAPTPFPGTTLPTFTPHSYTPQNVEMTWGFGVGGHILRNRIFWFVAADGYYRNNPGVSSARHADRFFAEPTACGPGAACPVGFQDLMTVLSARLGGSSNPWVDGVTAYSGMLEKLASLLGSTPRSAKQWIGFGRLDWEATDRDHLTVEGNGSRWNAPNGVLTRTSENFGNHSYGMARASEAWGLGRWEHFMNPNLLTVTQGSWARDVVSQRPGTPSVFEQSFMDNVWGRVPQIVVDSRDGFTIGTPARLGEGSYPDERRIQAREYVNWVHGRQLTKAGFEYGHTYDDVGILLNQTGTYHYSTVYNFISDALVYQKYGVALSPLDQHNCDQTGKVWRDSAHQLRGLGNLPCYSYYTQTMGPVGRSLSTNDWAAYITEQWQPKKRLTVSVALRWERQQLPRPIASLVNPDIPGTAHLPQLGNEWAPRASLAWATGDKHWPVIRLGYGIYYGRTQNSTLETALTYTGSLNGDMSFFVRPTDNLNSGGAPPFPYVFAGPPLRLVKPGAVEFAPRFRNPEVHQAIVAVEESLPGHITLTGSALISLGRRLPTSIDTNIAPNIPAASITYAVVDGTGKGPIKNPSITVPFYASWPAGDCPPGAKLDLTGKCGRLNPNYQQIAELSSKANSTYEAALLRLSRTGRNGLTLSAHYTYSHAMDWNPNESISAATSDVLDPAHFRLEYGTSNQDVRHVLSGSVVWQSPWKLRGRAGLVFNKWRLSAVGHMRSGRPYTMRTTGAIPRRIDQNGALIVGLGSSINGSGGDNRLYGVGRNTYRYSSTWKADLRLGKRIDLGGGRQLELMADTFNLFNHQNVTEIETVGYVIGSSSDAELLPQLTFLTGLKPNSRAFGKPLNINATNYYRPRQFEFGARMRF